MSDDIFMMVGLHKLAQQNGDGMVLDLLERVSAIDAPYVQSAEIVPLPGLHERPVNRNRQLAEGLRRTNGDNGADVLDFPLPRWRRNAQANGGD